MASTQENSAEVGTVGSGVLGSLLRAARRASADELAGLVDEHGRLLGLAGADIWLVDHGQRRLVRLGSARTLTEATSLPVEGSPAGEVFRWLAPVEADGEGWLPLTAGSERLGVLQVRLGETAPPADLDVFALLVGELVLTKSLYTDNYFRLRRRQKMSLEAELQWSLLPPLSAHCAGTSVAGVLEPAYDVGGDVFDHALNDSVLHLAVFDAVGHDVAASIVSHVVLGAYRHARRTGAGLAATATFVDEALSTYVGDTQFATGVLAQVDCPSGQLQWLGAGHPTPLLLRAGQVVELTGRASQPFGLGIAPPEPELVQLQPGDRVLFYTDGVIDERIWSSESDAIDWLSQRLVKTVEAGFSLEEILRDLMVATVDRWEGNQRDDATLLLVGWSLDGPD